MILEKEKKYRIKSQYVFNKLVSRSLCRALIVQWYDNAGLRTRLEKLSDNEIWTLNYKKELTKGIREEEERTIEKSHVNVEDLKCQRMVMKHRYLLNKDPEIVIDELLNPNNCINYKKDLKEIKYLLEIEEKTINIDLDSYLKDFLVELYFGLEDLTYKEGYNNSDFAGEYVCEWDALWKYINSKIL